MTQTVKNLPAVWENWVQSLDWEDSPGRGHGNPCQYSCLENPHGQRSLVVTFSSFICLLESRILYTNSIPFIHYTLATFSFQLSLPEVPTANFFLFFFKKVLFFKMITYLFITMLLLRCCVWAFSTCGMRRLHFAVAHELLSALTSLLGAHRLQGT